MPPYFGPATSGVVVADFADWSMAKKRSWHVWLQPLSRQPHRQLPMIATTEPTTWSCVNGFLCECMKESSIRTIANLFALTRTRKLVALIMPCTSMPVKLMPTPTTQLMNTYSQPKTSSFANDAGTYRNSPIASAMKNSGIMLNRLFKSVTPVVEMSTGLSSGERNRLWINLSPRAIPVFNSTQKIPKTPSDDCCTSLAYTAAPMMIKINGQNDRILPSGGFEKKRLSMIRDNNGDNALNVITRDIGAYLSAKSEVSSMPRKKGTTQHHRRTSFLDPMCKESQQNTDNTKTVKPICVATRKHGCGTACTASLLKTSMPTEQKHQDVTPPINLLFAGCAPFAPWLLLGTPIDTEETEIRTVSCHD